MSHFSSILHDNEASNVNEMVMDMLYDNELHSVSLLALDNVAKNGNAILSVLRNACGQSIITDTEQCGAALPIPKLLGQSATVDGRVCRLVRGVVAVFGRAMATAQALVHGLCAARPRRSTYRMAKQALDDGRGDQGGGPQSTNRTAPGMKKQSLEASAAWISSLFRWLPRVCRLLMGHSSCTFKAATPSLSPIGC
jgi:hypothetical protein